MTWETKYIYKPVYACTSINQHGSRYKRQGTKQFAIVKLSTECDNTQDMRKLILLSHHLDVPVHYDFDSDPQVAYIELASAQQLKNL